jgi:hypothetical protein
LTIIKNFCDANTLKATSVKLNFALFECKLINENLRKGTNLFQEQFIPEIPLFSTISLSAELTCITNEDLNRQQFLMNPSDLKNYHIRMTLIDQLSNSRIDGKVRHLQEFSLLRKERHQESFGLFSVSRHIQDDIAYCRYPCKFIK